MREPDYQRGDVKLYLGDCRDVLPHLSGVDAVLTDPPYGISYKCGNYAGSKWDSIRHQDVTIKDDTEPFDPSLILSLSLPTILWGANFYSDKLPGAGWLIWDKRPGIEDADWSRSDAEVAWISTKKTIKTFRHLWFGLCRATEVGKHLHPTQKPVALMAWCLTHLPGDSQTILDPFMGCGPTGVACVRTGRKFIGVEFEEKYFQIAAKRIDAELSQPRLFPAALEPELIQQGMFDGQES